MLAAQLEYIRPLYCRMCGGCSGTCPQGLPVADILRYLTYAEGYGQFALGREHFKQLPPDISGRALRSVPKLHSECPNGVKVSQRLTRAQEVFA